MLLRVDFAASSIGLSRTLAEKCTLTSFQASPSFCTTALQRVFMVRTSPS